MTSIVGIRCKDGVVIGTDSAATFDDGRNLTIAQPTEKLDIVGGRIILAGTGAIGLGQRFCRVIRENWDNKALQGAAHDIAATLCRAAIQDFASTNAPQAQYGALVAFPAQQKAHLVEFPPKDLQPEFKDDRIWYASMGIAQAITDTLLSFIREVFWEAGPPTLSDGIFAATWTLDHATQVAPACVAGPVQLAILSRRSSRHLEAQLLSEEDLMEHRQNIKDAKDCLRQYKQLHKGPAATPTVPTP